MKIGKCKGYVVEVTPKHEGSGYRKHIVSPYRTRVKWSKKRAHKEGLFAMKKTIKKTGEKVRDAYRFKVIKSCKN